MTTGNSASARDVTENLLSGETADLSNLDLLTLLVGDLAGSLIDAYPMLTALDGASGVELAEVSGATTDAVARLLAARELAHRRARERARRGAPVLDSRDAVKLLDPLLQDETREVVVVLALDTKRRLVCPPITVAIGTIDSVSCHPREVFRSLIRVSASACLVAHLHPSSGEPVPSPDDIMLTERLRAAGELIGIDVLDHIVLGRGTFLSMLDRGLL